LTPDEIEENADKQRKNPPGLLKSIKEKSGKKNNPTR
jgi:hypothetical protein